MRAAVHEHGAGTALACALSLALGLLLGWSLGHDRGWDDAVSWAIGTVGACEAGSRGAAAACLRRAVAAGEAGRRAERQADDHDPRR